MLYISYIIGLFGDKYHLLQCMLHFPEHVARIDSLLFPVCTVHVGSLIYPVCSMSTLVAKCFVNTKTASVYWILQHTIITFVRFV